MRNNYLKALLPLLLLAAWAHADQPGPPPPGYVVKVKRVPRYQYRNRMMVFTPWHQGYERIQNHAFYVGVEGYVTPVAALPENNHHSNNNTLFNAELRFGYNYFFNGRDHVTPFTGIGYVQQYFGHHHHHHDRDHRPGVVYGTVGFLYAHEFNTIFNLGCTGKFMLGGPVDDKHPQWGSPIIGLDVSVPWTFRFGPRRHWDVRLEPFYMVLHGPKVTQNYIGGRSNVGYRF